MKPPRFRRFCSLPGRATLAAAALLLSAGCANVFQPKHKVLIDAISAPGSTKPTGKSYRLVAKRSMISQGSVQVIKACVDAALLGVGMFEPPANVAPDYFIEVSYGRESAPRADAGSRETFIQLSARTNPEGSLDKATGPEVWDVKAAVLGVAGSIETAMPLLTAVGVNYLGADTRLEQRVDVPQNSPMVESVRSAAIKMLEGKSAPPPPSGSPTAATAPTPAVNASPAPR